MSAMPIGYLASFLNVPYLCKYVYPTFAHVYPYGMYRANDEMFTFTPTLEISKCLSIIFTLTQIDNFAKPLDPYLQWFVLWQKFTILLF